MDALLRSVAHVSMALARRLGKGSGCGVILTEHLLSAQETRAHVEALARWFDFIHHDDVLDRLARPRSRPFCLLTFDDGKRLVAEQTAPELERLGVPAVFYVPTRFLTERRPLWFDRQQAICRALGHVPPDIEAELLKRLAPRAIDERLDRACARDGLMLEFSTPDVTPMSWDQARDLTRRGFTIGAHGRDHHILTRLPEALAFDEIRDSMNEVSARVGSPCVSFAFPNGNYTRRLAEHAVACGARTVMTTEPVWAAMTCPAWRLPRIEVLGPDRPLKIACKLAAAATGRVLANPDGTGRLYSRRHKAAFSS